MSKFIVKRNLAGITMDKLDQAQQLAIKTCEKMTEEGTPISYIRSNFFPANSTCFCMIEAEAARIVEKMNGDAPSSSL